MSMPCPKCGKDTGVSDSRWVPTPKGAKDSYLRRRRYCRNAKCVHVFSTVEQMTALSTRGIPLRDIIEERARQLVGKAIQKIGRRFAKGEE
jgi:transcriptional regulator NrdR family protein